MIKLTQISKTFGDSTAKYSVEMSKPYTVAEFIEEVLTREEWGSIGIFDEDQAWFESGNPSCEYKRDELLSELPEEVQNDVVLKADAHGGWSNMDYKLHTKQKDMTESEKKRKTDFIAAWYGVEKNAAEVAIEHGWVVKDTDEDKGLKIALMHSELSEALEAVRQGNPASKKIPDYTNLEEELADVVLRIMNFGHQLGLNLADAIIAKDDYNAKREYKHGGKPF